MPHQHSRTDLISEFGDLTVGLYERIQALTDKGVAPHLVQQFEKWGEKVLEDITKLQRTYFYVLDKAEALAKSRPSRTPAPRHSSVRSLRPRRRR